MLGKKLLISVVIFILFSVSQIFAQTNNRTQQLKDTFSFKETTKEVYKILLANRNDKDLKSENKKIPVLIIAKDPISNKVLWEISIKMASYLKQIDKKNLLAIIDRKHIKEIIKERKRSGLAIFNEKERVRLAKLLSAHVIIFVEKKENKYLTPFLIKKNYICNINKVSNSELLNAFQITETKITPLGWSIIVLFSFGVLAFIFLKIQDSLKKDTIICPKCGEKNPLYAEKCSNPKCGAVLFQ